MRRFLLTVAAAATAVVGTACSDSTGISGNVAGSYELVTVNNQAIPATFNFGGETVTYLGGTLEIDSDGTFVDSYQYRVNGQVFDEVIFGTWERNGSRIEFRDDDNFNNVYFMERTSTNRLVYVDEDTGARWVYRRF